VSLAVCESDSHAEINTSAYTSRTGPAKAIYKLLMVVAQNLFDGEQKIFVINRLMKECQRAMSQRALLAINGLAAARNWGGPWKQSR
jgi:hypothetical protein